MLSLFVYDNSDRPKQPGIGRLRAALRLYSLSFMQDLFILANEFFLHHSQPDAAGTLPKDPYIFTQVE
jgi:hypothetical protein